jgi:hypothetical protein
MLVDTNAKNMGRRVENPDTDFKSMRVEICLYYPHVRIRFITPCTLDMNVIEKKKLSSHC